jgi:Domain of unknown function (DUF4145)
MAHILADCPHCGGIKVGFAAHAQYLIQPKGTWLVFFICGNCEQGILAEYYMIVNKGVASPAAANGKPEDSGFGMLARGYYPEPAPTQIPDHLSAPLDRYFQQAADALKREDWDSSGIMSRRVVDVSTQLQLGETESKKAGDLRNRIDVLADKGHITRDLQQWAHEIRLGGNEAVHDKEPYSKDDAEDLLNFSELYLTYVYSLPGRLADRKARKDGESVVPPTLP